MKHYLEVSAYVRNNLGQPTSVTVWTIITPVAVLSAYVKVDVGVARNRLGTLVLLYRRRRGHVEFWCCMAYWLVFSVIAD